MTFSSEQIAIEKVCDKQKQQRNYPAYKTRLNGRWYRFALHRPIQGEIKRVQVYRDALGDMYITQTEDYTEIKIEPSDSEFHKCFCLTFAEASSFRARFITILATRIAIVIQKDGPISA